MSEPNWKRIDEVYAQALELNPSCWQEFLDKACANDPPEVRAQVHAWLEDHQREQVFQQGAEAKSAGSQGDELDLVLRGLAGQIRKQCSLEPPAQLLGRYTIKSVLGTGGMGVVYRATDDHFTPPRPVAVKMISPLLISLVALDPATGAELEKRFRSEADILSRMTGEHFVRIYDVGEWQRQFFFVMELVEGESLDKTIALKRAAAGYSDKRPFPGAGEVQRALMAPNDAARLIEQLAEAISQPHSLQIVHRDLKPGNVLMLLAPPDKRNKSGQVADKPPKITDFGIARFMGELAEPPSSSGATVVPDRAMTQTGRVIGTREYMAPEQWAGDSGKVGPAADIYALGAILYELLTGAPAFVTEAGRDPQAACPAEASLRAGSAERASAMSVLSQHGPTERLRQLVLDSARSPSRLKNIPADLEAICLKCLAKAPENRYANAKALKDDLTHFLAGEPVYARPIGLPERVWKWCRRSPYQTTALILLFVALLFGAAALLVEKRRADEQEDNANKQIKLRIIADTATHDARLRANVATMKLAQGAWDVGDIPRLVELLESQLPERMDGDDLRGFEWYYLWRLAHSNFRTIEGSLKEDYATSVAFSPDGARIAIARFKGAVGLWDCMTGKGATAFNWTPAWGGGATAMAFSDDGKHLAIANDRIEIWELSPVQRKTTLNTPWPKITSMAYRPDRDFIADGNESGTVRIWDVQEKKATFVLEGHTGKVNSVAFSPDGKWLVTGGEDGTVRIWDARERKAPLVLEGHTGKVNSVAFSPDGKWLVTGGEDGTVRIWDVQEKKASLVLEGHTGEVNSVVFSPDGKWLVTGGKDKIVRIWVAHTDGPPLLILKGHTSAIIGATFVKNRKTIASVDIAGTLRIWNTEEGQEAVVLRAAHAKRPDSAEQAIFSPDGKRIASWGADELVRIWDPQESKMPLFVLQGHMRDVTTVAFSTDGESVASGSMDGTVRLWNAKTGQEAVPPIEGDTGIVTCVAFSPIDTRLAWAGKDRKVRIREATGGRVSVFADLGKAEIDCIIAMAFSPDGKRIATGDERGLILVWDGNEKEKPLLTIEGHKGWVNSLAFSPDGMWIASGGEDGAVRLSDTQTGKQLLKLQVDSNPVTCMALSQDCKRLATGHEDGTVRLWDTHTGQDVLALKGHTSTVRSVSFSRDGWQIVSGANDGVRIWYATRPP